MLALDAAVVPWRDMLVHGWVPLWVTRDPESESFAGSPAPDELHYPIARRQWQGNGRVLQPGSLARARVALVLGDRNGNLCCLGTETGRLVMAAALASNRRGGIFPFAELSSTCWAP